MKHTYTNQLIHESSPYLLQHAHNPVNWYPWGNEALNKAHKENKLLLVSIGYSSCHWCHVMEHESFESEEVAQIMNENFICIKVDREEHPDVDHIYMSAVQLTSGRGGWPLNCIALPDGRPFFGGTYFPKEHWISVLQQISHLYATDRQKVVAAADQLALGIQQSELIEKIAPDPEGFSMKTLEKAVLQWKPAFDNKYGGSSGAPKFPLPNNYEFLLRYACNKDDDEVSDHVELTLKQMAYGGIYDQIGGGFARYSTDEKWKIPHFEKMLYDNAQLVSLYSHAYQRFKNPLYKKIVEETLSFVKRELTSSEGLFFSALDADSEGVEGKYYVWNKEELKRELGSDANLFFEYYRMNKDAYWEAGQYVLLQTEDAEKLAEKHEMNMEELHQKMGLLKEKLLIVRQQRIRPGLDDKILTSWNALMISAYVDAYMALQNKSYLETALKAALLIKKRVKKEDGGLYHTYKNGMAKINGLLDDYACTIESNLALYSATLDNNWLVQAIDLNDYVLKHFYDQESGMFFYTSDENRVLVVRKKEVFDNVIPSSNSIMARNLKKLTFYTDNHKLKEISRQMLINVANQLTSHGSSFSNWALLMMDYLDRNYEVVICCEDAYSKLRELQKHYAPNILWAGTTSDDNTYSFLKSRFISGKTKIYVCENNACQLPVENIEDAKKMLGI